MAACRWVNVLVTYGLTACILGSAPGPTLDNEYGRTLPLPNIANVWFWIESLCFTSTVNRLWLVR